MTAYDYYWEFANRGLSQTFAFCKPCNPTFCAAQLFIDLLNVHDSVFSVKFSSQNCVKQGCIVDMSFKMHFLEVWLIIMCLEIVMVFWIKLEKLLAFFKYQGTMIN